MIGLAMENHERFIDCPCIGGPKDGLVVRWVCSTPTYVQFPCLWNCLMVDLYLLVGNLDDGYRFVYEGKTRAKV